MEVFLLRAGRRGTSSAFSFRFSRVDLGLISLSVHLVQSAFDGVCYTLGQYLIWVTSTSGYWAE